MPLDLQWSTVITLLSAHRWASVTEELAGSLYLKQYWFSRQTQSNHQRQRQSHCSHRLYHWKRSEAGNSSFHSHWKRTNGLQVYWYYHWTDSSTHVNHLSNSQRWFFLEGREGKQTFTLLYFLKTIKAFSIYFCNCSHKVFVQEETYCWQRKHILFLKLIFN